MNLLPCDGIAYYHGRIFDDAEAEGYFRRLAETIAWRRDEVVMFGKRIVTEREVAWYGDSGFCYVYSGRGKTALPWTEELAELKRKVEAESGETYNSCLLNLYHDGSEGMGWHSDDEKSLARHAAIASLSLGAERRFLFRHKTTKALAPVVLENGSLLVMKGETQTHWKHSLPKSRQATGPRINLTFRTMAG